VPASTGFSLHANTQVPAHRRDQLERLIRSTARGAVALERLAQDANGDLISTFTHPWSDGTTGIRLSPVELLEKLAALVPLPRVHLVRYGGCLALYSHLRGAIIPTTDRKNKRHFRATPLAARLPSTTRWQPASAVFRRCRLALWAACAFAALRGVRSGQWAACQAASLALARLEVVPSGVG
jgi:hypothetical protein